ncbi:MAG: SM-20-related protein [Paraglaciecola sp.]|jgi:SM-20-related protein
MVSTTDALLPGTTQLMSVYTALKFDEQKIAQICLELTQQGYSVIVDFLPQSIALSLLQEVVNDTTLDFKQAAIGREQLEHINSTIRNDRISWLDGSSVAQKSYLQCMEQVRIAINRQLFLGLFDYESHYAYYGPGDFYQRHVDAFHGRSNRVLSSIVYLNQAWLPDDQGELLMFHGDQPYPFLTVAPNFNQCILFLSEQFPHEVRVAKRHRYSIAGWFRINNSIGGQVDPSK